MVSATWVERCVAIRASGPTLEVLFDGKGVFAFPTEDCLFTAVTLGPYV